MKMNTSMKRGRKTVSLMLVTSVLFTSTLFTGCGSKEGIKSGMITTVQSSNYSEKFTAEGTIECAEPHYIYSTLTLPAQEVLVKEGDKVKKGDLLCVLDSTTIEEQIAVKEATIELSGKRAASSVASATIKYNGYNDALTTGENLTLVEALGNQEAARQALETSLKAYEDYKQTLDLGKDPTLIAADQEVASASTRIQQAQSMQYELDDIEGTSKLEKEKAEDEVDSAYLSYAQATQNRDALLRQSNIQLANLAKAAENANYNYLVAQKGYASAVRSLENAKAESAEAITQASLLGDTSVEELQLAQLENQLLNSQIVADCSGTVTAVNIKVGENSTGVLFVIEDTSDLIFTAKVSEKEINNVSEGMTVSVTTNAENSKDYKGTVERVAAYTEKTAEGETDTSGKDAEFLVTIRFEDADEDARIGMNGKASFIAYEEESGIAVPNEAVFSADDGKKYVLTISSDKKSGTINKTEVSTIYKGKRESLIEGKGISSGTHVIVDAASYMDMVGKEINITD